MADITDISTQEGVAYLSLVTDAFSRKIVGYHVVVSCRSAVDRSVKGVYHQILLVFGKSDPEG